MSPPPEAGLFTGRSSPYFWAPPALLLITAALAKATTPLSFLYELSNYNFNLPLLGEASLALFLPGLELFLGLSLLLNPNRWAALIAILLLTLFSTGILVGLPSGYLQHCGCMGPEKLAPFFALLKNGVALLLLILGFFSYKFRVERCNPWAALGLVIGGAWTGFTTLIFILLGLVFSLKIATKARMAYPLGVLLGIFLYLTGFPLLTMLAAAMVLYFFPVDSSKSTPAVPISFTLVMLVLTSLFFINAPPPESAPRLLRLGEPLAPDLKVPETLHQGFPDQYLLLYLRPDCEDCRAWLPAAISLGQRSTLPPVFGVIPQTTVSLEQYRQRESLSFPLFAVKNSVFNWAVRRTPFLVWVQRDTVKMIFKEGSLPRASELETLISHASASSP